MSRPLPPSQPYFTAAWPSASRVGPNVVRRRGSEEGVAIGPILFVVTILAILATAIAAGASSFATNASQETNRTYAASLVQMGQNIKMGVDRVVALGTPIVNVVINDADTSSNLSLFAPVGGGIVPPSRALAADPGNDTWIYTWAVVPGIGSADPDRITMLKVNVGVCDQINTQNNNTGTFSADLGPTISNVTNISTWPAGLTSRMVGCVTSTNPITQGAYFYQILSVQ
jgi:type II secretory pathway pseudopilin PulG